MTTLEGPADRYRRRRRWPILALVVVLLVGAGVIWFQILKPTPALATGCNEPGPVTTTSSTSRSRASASETGSAASDTAAAAPTTPTTPSPSSAAVSTALGQYVDTATLASTRPANPQTIALQVFNASQTVGLAGTVTKDLRDSGFASIRDASNDVLYPAYDLNCYAQIRFGAAGVSQARTVLMVAPCAQLVMDNRIDASVDLSLGSLYRFDGTGPDVRAQLQQIIDESAPPPVVEGQTAAARPQGAIPPLPQLDCSAGAPPVSAPVSSSSSVPSPTPTDSPAPGSESSDSSSSESVVESVETVTPGDLPDDESAEAPDIAPQEGDDIFGG